MARDTLPAYEQDDGPLTDKQFARLKQMVPQGRMRVTTSLQHEPRRSARYGPLDAP